MRLKEAMSEKVTPYKDTSRSKKEQVTEMFDTISGTYDNLNRVITFGIDLKWRKKLIKWVAATEPNCVLDIATGTGDLAIALAKETEAQEIIGLDISPGMLDIGKGKVNAQGLNPRIQMVIGDSENLAYPDAYFDAITVAFGVRNFENLNKGLSEIYRCLKPGGILAILETSVPTNPLIKAGYGLYTKLFLPTIGKLFSKDRSAYAYLSESASKFPFGKAFNNILTKNGFIEVVNKPQTFGVATIYTATK